MKWIIFFFLLLVTPIKAQDSSNMYMLKRLHDAYWKQENFDMSSVYPIITALSESEIMQSTDSLKYYYHFWKANIYKRNNLVAQEKEHLLKAITLRESSVGILDPEYIELLWELGSISEEDDVEKSIYYYQKALVIGQTILYNKQILPYNIAFMQNTYGIVLSDLARMYEKMNWKDRVPSLYESAFRLRSQFYDKNDPNCYVDMYALASYYRNEKEFGKAVETIQKVINYIEKRGGYGSNSYVNASFVLASALSQNNQHTEALNVYKSTIKLAIDSLERDNKNLHLLYGNYCVELANNEDYVELNHVLPQACSFYARTDSFTTYISVLFTISRILCDKEQYKKADIFNDSLFHYISYLPDMAKEMLYSQKTQIELGKGNVLSAIEFKQKELELERKNGISNKLHYLSVYSELGSLYSYNSQTETALDLYKTVLDSLEKDNLEDNVLYGQCISFVSNLYSIIQRPDMLQHFMKQKKQLLIEKHKTQNYIFAQICNNLSVLQMQINQLDEAFENNALVLPLFLNLYGKQSDNYATALHNKGRILMLQGKHKSALEYLMQSKQIQLEVNNSVYPNTEKYIQDLESK